MTRLEGLIIFLIQELKGERKLGCCYFHSREGKVTCRIIKKNNSDKSTLRFNGMECFILAIKETFNH